MNGHRMLNLLSARNINLNAIKLSKEKHNLLLVNQPSSLHYWLIKLRFRFVHQLIILEQEVPFHLPQCTTPEAVSQIQLPTVLCRR